MSFSSSHSYRCEKLVRKMSIIVSIFYPEEYKQDFRQSILIKHNIKVVIAADCEEYMNPADPSLLIWKKYHSVEHKKVCGYTYWLLANISSILVKMLTSKKKNKTVTSCICLVKYWILIQTTTTLSHYDIETDVQHKSLSWCLSFTK